MPELADVEGFRRYFARYAAGHEIESVGVADPGLVRNTSAQGLGRALRGHRFEKPRRHGKWLIAPAEGARVLMHFGMTGLLVWSRDGEDRHPHDRITFRLDEGELRYRNMRRFGGLWLARDEAATEKKLGPLGPDAMEVSEAAFRDLIGSRRGGIKAALLDQTFIAGLGNLLSDEILWRARVDPRSRASKLSRRRVGAVHREMREVLRISNRHGRVPRLDGWLTGVRDEREARCPRGHGRLRRETVAGRTTVWCSTCQS
jgi:formamidopyrimidine-DNA glycosylase